MISPAKTMETMDVSLIRMLSEEPEVSLNGSPTIEWLDTSTERFSSHPFIVANIGEKAIGCNF